MTVEHSSPLEAPICMMESDHFSSRYRPVDLSLCDLAVRVQFAPVAKKSYATSPGLFFGVAEQRPQDKTIRGDRTHARSAVVLDLEGESVPHDVPQRVAALPWAALTYASPSYTEAKPRWRVVLPSEKPLSPTFTPVATGYVAQCLGAYEWIDWSCGQSARRFYAPLISEANADRASLEANGLPCYLSEGTERRWFSPEDAPSEYALPVQHRSSERVPDRGGRRKADPRASDSQFGVFSRCYDLDALIEKSVDWPCGRIPYAPSKPGMWYWTGAACDDAESADEPSLSQIEPGVPVYKDHAASSPQAGRTSSSFDIAASWMYGPLATQDGRPNYDAGLSSDTPPQDRPSSRMFWDFIAANPALFTEMTDETFAKVPEELQECADEAGASGDPAPPSRAERGAWSVKRIWGELSPLDLKTGARKLDDPADQKLIARRDPVLRSLARDVRSDQVGWCMPPPGREVNDQERAQFRKRGLFPRKSEDVSLVRVYVEETYARRQVTADVAKKILDLAVAGARSVDAFRDYLDALPAWDGTPRLDRWHAGVRDTPADHLAMRRFVIALVARTFDPGCEVGWLPVFLGDQNTLKTTTLQWLTGDRYYQLMDLDEPHLMEKLVQFPLVIWDEFHLAQSDRDPFMNKAKALITASSDMWHENYSTSESGAERMWVLAATANSFEVPPDMDGMRRFMPVHIESDGGERNRDGSPKWRTEALREQVLAEAVYEWRKPPAEREAITLTDEEGRAAQERAIAEVRQELPEMAPILQFATRQWPENWCSWSWEQRKSWRVQFAGAPNLDIPGTGDMRSLDWVTIQILIDDALPPSYRNASNRVRTRIKRALKELGFRKGYKRVNRKSLEVWWLPDDLKADSPAVLEASRLTAEAAAHA